MSRRFGATLHCRGRGAKIRIADGKGLGPSPHAGQRTMNNSQLQAASARCRRDQEVVKGWAVGLAGSVALLGSPVWGVMIGTVSLALGAGAKGAPSGGSLNFAVRNLGWIVASAAV